MECLLRGVETGDRRQGRDTKPPSPPPLFFYSIGVFCPKKSCFKCKRDASLLHLIRFFSNLSLVVSSPPSPSVSLYMCFLLPDKVDCDGTKGCILTTHPNEGNEDSYFIFIFSVICKPPKVMYFWSCSVRSSVNHVLTLLELKSS